MKNKDITNVITQGRAFKSSSFLLKVHINPDAQARNVAVLASKKVFKTAVLRNKVRRKVKAAITSVLKSMPGKHLDPSMFLVITAYNTLPETGHLDLTREMRNILEKSDMLI